jgi:hypothetical protein
VVWAFNTVPSQLHQLYEQVSYYDLKTKIQLKAEEKMADTMQMHETLCIVVTQALGGASSSEPDPSTAPKTVDELEARLTRVLG